MKKRAICVLLAFAMIFVMMPTITFADSYGDFIYIDNGDGTCTITDYTGSGGSVEIPQLLNGLSVTIIGTAAFSENNITSVIIPESVERIEKSGFWSNPLSTVIIPDNVTYIGEGAFTSNELVSVTIGEKVSEICDNAFIANDITSVIIPNSVTSIGQKAFLQNNLTTVTLGSGVTSIGEAAFNDNEIASVTGGGTSDGIIYARNGDGSVDNSTIVSYGGVSDTIDFIPSNVKIIGARAFQDNQLTSAIIPQGIEKVNEYAFFCNSLTTINIPDTVKELGECAFYSNDLVSVSIPDGVKSIGVSAFMENQLTSVSLPSSIIYIGEYAFSDNSLSSFSLPVCTPEEGYNFSEWKDGNNTSYSGGAEVSDHTTSYTAQLSTIEYTITYNTNGGTNNPGNPGTYTVEDEDITLLSPTLEDNIFDGWYDGSDFDTANIVTTISRGSTGDIEICAKWTEISGDTFAQGDGTGLNPYGISTPAQLNEVRTYLDSHFILLNDIDLDAATSAGGDYYNDGAGWESVGTDSEPFRGVFDGGGYAVNGLNQIVSLNAPNCGGLFGYVDGGTIQNLGMEGDDIFSSRYNVGGIVGYISGGTITNCYHTGVVTADEAGGIIGSAYDNSIISNCYNTGTILGTDLNGNGGGIIGHLYSGEVSSCYNAGDITGVYAGGIAGSIGEQHSTSTVSDCYNIGNVRSTGCTGGIVGREWQGNNNIDNCYNTGSVSGDNSGGIVGLVYRDITDNCFYLDRISVGTGNGTDTSICVTHEQMLQPTTFTDFDFGTVWTMQGDDDYPYPELQNCQMNTLSSSSFEGGSGMPYDPYQISTPAQFNNVRHHMNSYFVMLNDIVFSAVDFEENGDFYNDGEGWEPIGSKSEPFSGVFDGGGYAIKGLYQYIETNESIYGGIFGRVENCTIRYLGLEASSITIKSVLGCDVGGIAGMAKESIITNCYNTSFINGGSDVGGIVGHIYGGELNKCYNTGNISSNYYCGEVGGIAGVSGTDMIRDCFNVGSVTGGTWAGGIAGNIYEISDDYRISNCYNAGMVLGKYAGGIAGDAWYGEINNCYFLDNMIAGVGDDIDESTSVTIEQMATQETFVGFDFGSVWTMEGNADYSFPEFQEVEAVVQPVSTEFAGGRGASYDPFKISNVGQLNNVRNYPHSDFILVNDIVFTEADFLEGGEFYNNGEGFLPFGTLSEPFTGCFDGKGYSIMGLYQNISGSYHVYAGLFGYIDLGAIKDLSLKSVDIYVNSPGFSSYVGGVAGYIYEGFISDCTIDGIIRGEESINVGGVTGSIKGGIIIECRNEATLNGSLRTGGIAGNTKENLEGTYIIDCENIGSIGEGGSIGGIVGMDSSDGNIEGCINSGSINGGRRSGGIVGWNFNPGTIIKKCYNTANIEATSDGLSNYAGGIVGCAAPGLIEQCWNSGHVTCDTEGINRAGGIAGEASGTIKTCYSTGEIFSADDAGGIVGYLRYNSYEPDQGNKVYDCYNTGRISGADDVGGIIGVMNTSTVRTCYNTGSISATDTIGGIIGDIIQDDSEVENCYYIDKALKGVGEGTDLTVSATYEQMKQQATFFGFEFTDNWEIVEGERFPILQGLPFEYTTGISLDSISLDIEKNAERGLTSTINPSNATNKNVTWSSSDERVATVENGLVTAISVGTVTITAMTVDGGFTDTCEVTVTQSVTGVFLNKEETKIHLGVTESLIVTINPADATNQNVTWSSDNESVATVADGVVTGVSKGTAIITVTTVDGGYTDTCEVTVIKAVTGVSLDKKTDSVNAGYTTTLAATVSPSDAGIKDMTWSSSNTSVATVADGVVTGVSVGTATITVTTVDGGYTDTCEITVTHVPVTGVSLEWSTLTVYAETESMALFSTVYPENASNKKLIWSSSNSSVAAVFPDGLVDPLSSGTATITVKTEDGGFTATCVVTVKERKIESNVYSIDNTYISGIAVNTSVEQLKANLLTNPSWIKIFDASGVEYTGSTVTTGMKVKFYLEGDVTDELTVIVLGDANGDGGISITDYTLARLDILGLKSLGQTAAKAVDINGDSKVSITDYTLMRLDILGLKKIH